MRRKILIIFVGLVLIGLVVVGLFWKEVFFPSSVKRMGEASLLPELSLSVNGSIHASITQGMPLVFEVMLYNGPAARAAGAAESKERLKAELDGVVQKGKITRQQADEILKKEPGPSPAPSRVITLAAKGFSFRGGESKRGAMIPWHPKMVDPAAPVTVTLDERQTAYAIFVVSPEETASAAKGTYQVIVSFENRSSGQWQGEIVSDKVEITVAEAAKAPSVEDQEEKHLSLAEYFLTLKDYDRAVHAVQQALSISPQSIDAFALMGQAQEGKGDYRAALDAYQRAFREFRGRYPDSRHPPWEILRSMRRMEEKLGIQLPQVFE